MPRIKITKAAEQNHLPITNTVVSADIPIDGCFHEIHPDLIPVLTDSGVEFEVEDDEPAAAPTGNAGAARGSSGRSGRRGKAGGSSRAAKPRAKKAKAK